MLIDLFRLIYFWHKQLQGKRKFIRILSVKNLPHKNTVKRRDIIDSNPQPASPPSGLQRWPRHGASPLLSFIFAFAHFETYLTTGRGRGWEGVYGRATDVPGVALGRLDIGMLSVEVAAGDGKLIKLSLIYPSPGGRPTHGISRSSIFVVTLRPRSPSPYLPPPFLSLSTHRTFPASICLAPIPGRPACGI